MRERFMRSYSFLMNASGGDGHYVELTEAKFMELLRCLLVLVEVDEVWYRSTYRDVDEAVKAGEITSGRHHYINAGYFENRLPRRIDVNERWYLEEYPDVAAAIQYGAFPSAAQHFERDGFKEGRLPSENWSLLGAPARQLLDA
jgi:hypothetical protein